jgi:DNA-binding NtrC family response regulator
VSISLHDTFLLETLAERHGWELTFARLPREAFHLASNAGFDVILCDRDQPGYPWREVMDRLADRSPNSCILLISPTVNDYLWWEVLHHRGFDVLTHPLHEDGVLRAINTVLRCVPERREQPAQDATPLRTA